MALTALWAHLPRGGAASATVATVVLFGSGGSLLALLPFLGADGQVMLEAALGRTELGRQTWRFWTVRPRAAGYRRDDVAVHTGYGVATVLAGAAGYALLMWLWYATLRPWTGPAAAVAVLAAETAAVLAVAVLLARRRARTTRKAPDER
jgi:putative peptide zinc metalloprotease protein